MLRKKPKPLSFGQTVRLVKKGVLSRAESPTFKPRQKVKLTDRRQSEHWTLSEIDKGATHGLSVSSIEKWLDNKEEFRLMKVEGLEGRTGSVALDFGDWWHWLLGRHYSNRHQRASNPRLDMENGAKVYRSQFQRDNPNAIDKRVEGLELGFLKTAALWPTYVAKYAAEDKAKKWVGIEADWAFKYSLPPIKHEWPAGSKKQIELFPGCTVDLHGIFDGVYRKEGRLWLFETKTKSRIDEAELDDTLNLDIQVMLYLYAIYRVYKEWPAGVTYNVIRNPQTEPSKKKGENAKTFVDRLTKEVEKDEDHYFKRWEMGVEQADIERFMDKVLDPILRDIQGWAYGHHPHYVHTKALIGKYGRSDMYDVITRGDLTGVEQRQLVRKER
jgi:ATP-dependent helicase/DNAse subunit B